MENEYFGYKSIVLCNEEIADYYSGKLVERLYIARDELLGNEYLIAFNEANEVLFQGRKVITDSDEKFVPVYYKEINSRFLGKVKPRNVHQQLAIDMLYNPEITVKLLTGRFGTGKDYLMVSAAIDLIEQNKFDKIVWIRNNVEVKDSRPIGYLPGDSNDKLFPFAMVLADHLGGIDGLNMMINKRKIEISHLGFIRGRDIKKSIIICSECENLTKEHVKLLLGRVAEGSELWMNGDFNQTDSEIFRINSGLNAAINTLKGHPLFGYVKLQKTERSKTAAMADLLG